MKTFLTILVLLFSLKVWSSSHEGFNQSDTAELKAEAVEEHSELYFMHGIQISHRLCFAANCESFILESDTLKTSFLVNVTFSSENPDSVLFDGLEGANTKPREMISKGFNGSAATAPDFLCRPSRDCGYAKLTGTELEIEVYTSSGYYSGTGTLENDRLTIQAEYLYRGAGADYFLEGYKIVEEK